jgi:hypothetical protein
MLTMVLMVMLDTVKVRLQYFMQIRKEEDINEVLHLHGNRESSSR